MKKPKFKLLTSIIAVLFVFSAMQQISHAQNYIPGTVVTWGHTYDGQTTMPANLTDVKAIAAGTYHSVALKDNGTVVEWGWFNPEPSHIPEDLTNVKAIAAGWWFTVALKEDGTVVAWGTNNTGVLSVPADLTNVKAIAAGHDHVLAVKEDGTVIAWGSDYMGQTIVPDNLTNVKAVAAGWGHSVALKEDGTVIAWGDNSYGQTTILSNITNVKAIAASLFHTLALREDGTVVAWGTNGYGESIVPYGLTNVIQIATGGYHNVALKDDGTVVAWGWNDGGECDVPPDLTNVKAIAAGYMFTNALTGLPQEQVTPTGLTAVSPTTYGGSDGIIAGTTNFMEYKLLADTQGYKAVTGTSITGLKAGTYNVRYAAKTGYNAGTDAVVVIYEKINVSVYPVLAKYGSTVTIKASLIPGTTSVSGKTLTFEVNGKVVGTAVTSSARKTNGTATLNGVKITLLRGTYPVNVYYYEDGLAKAYGSGTLTVK